MKKILAVTIAVVLLCMSLLVTVSAENKDELYNSFLAYCQEKLGSGNAEGVSVIDNFDYNTDVTYFRATSWLAPAQEGCYEVIGDYCVHSNVTEYPYALGVYVATNDEVYSLREAYDEGIIKSAFSASRFDGIIVHNAGKDIDLTHKCMDAFARYKNVTPADGEYVDCEVCGETEDAVVFRAHITAKDAVYPCICSQQRIGGYVFTHGYVIGPEDNPTGLYILKDGEVIPAPEAYSTGKISIDDLVRLAGGEEDPYGVEEAVVKELDLKGSRMDSMWDGNSEVYLYREVYAHYRYPSPFSAYDPEYVLVFAAEAPGQPIIPFGRLGNFAIVSYAAYGEHYGYYVYIPETKTLYTLKEAVEMNLEGIENAFANMGKSGGIIGDTDKDGKITVKDATYIQKALAGIEVQNPDAYDTHITKLIRDFDRDDKVNVKDATAIQKFVAGIKF